MKYEHVFYTTKYDNLRIEFLFLYISQEVGWRAYILNDINYKRCTVLRSTDWRFTHRFFEADDQRYIDKNRSYPFVCWTSVVQDLEIMKNVAAVWAELTAYYIRNGGTFAENQPRLAKQGII